MKFEGWVVIGLLALSSACGYHKEYAPVAIKPFVPRQPNQQRTIAQATLTAVMKAAASADLKKYAGRKARIEVNGVFPHSETDLLDYVGAIMAGEAARAGVRVLEPKDENKERTVVVSGGAEAAAPDEKPDVRLLVSVDWGGIDLKDRKYIKAWPLAGWIGVPTLGIFGGVAAAVASEEGAIAAPIIGTAILGTVVWVIFGDTTGHTFTMIGRTRVTVRGVPLSDGLIASFGEGEGESSIVIDPDSDVGYSLRIDVPRE